MLHTDQHTMVPFTLKSFLGVLLLLVLITAPLWWSRIRSISAAPRATLQGQWVGSGTVTASITSLGSSHSMHLPAALYVDLQTYDGFLEKVQGAGQLCLAGESQPRAIHIVTLGPPKPDGHLSGEISGDLYASNIAPNLKVPSAARILQGSSTDGRLDIHTVNDGATIGYVFETSLHRGTPGDFQSLCSQLHQQ